jgi:predicted secreted protein
MIRVVAVLALVVLPTLAVAQTPPSLPGDATLLHLSDRAERPVTRDVLEATLRVEGVDDEAAKLQAALNRHMTAAVARAKSVAGVIVATDGYWVYRDAPQNGGRWRGSATLSLRSQDSAALLALAGALQQDGLVMQSLGYELRPETARTVEDELAAEALGRLKVRAARIAETLGLAVERIRDLRVGNATGAEPPMPRFAAQAATAAEAPPPAAEPGEATVAVTVDAEVVLVPRR